MKYISADGNASLMFLKALKEEEFLIFPDIFRRMVLTDLTTNINNSDCFKTLLR